MPRRGRKPKVSKEGQLSNFLESEFGATSSPNNSLLNNSELNDHLKLIETADVDAKEKIKQKMEGHIRLTSGKINMLKIKLGSQRKQVFEYYTTEKVDSSQGNSGHLEQEKGTLSALSENNQNTRASRTRLIKSREKGRRSISEPPPEPPSVVRDKEGFVMPIGMITRSSSSHNKSCSSTVFETPLNKRPWKKNIAVVTPGPNANDPIYILRRPFPGERVISLTGSPLLVSSDAASSLPNITLPIEKKVVSIFPREGGGFDPGDFPSLDNNTIEQLTLLKDYIEAIVKI